jgi:DNA-binding Lrp family transcriptional regulator
VILARRIPGGMSKRKIAASLGVSETAAGECIRALLRDITWRSFLEDAQLAHHQFINL